MIKCYIHMNMFCVTYRPILLYIGCCVRTLISFSITCKLCYILWVWSFKMHSLKNVLCLSVCLSVCLSMCVWGVGVGDLCVCGILLYQNLFVMLLYINTVLCTLNTQDKRKSTHKSFRRRLSASSVKTSW